LPELDLPVNLAPFALVTTIFNMCTPSGIR
jgi:hypothetical protein